MKLECETCWEKQGKGFDVLTEHSINIIDKTATCQVCGTNQDIVEHLKGALSTEKE